MRSYECRKFLYAHLVKVINHAVVCMCVCYIVQLYFSITIKQICMKFGVDIAPNSGCFSLVLCHWSSFGFGVENVLASRFVSPFKCTVNMKLQKLITPHLKVLCN